MVPRYDPLPIDTSLDQRRHADARSPVTVRRAQAQDEAGITQLVLSERLNPSGLDWRRFHVASIGDRIVGAVQIRAHHDGSFELGSLVVISDHRNRGIAARLIDEALSTQTGRVHLVTAGQRAFYFQRWGFHATSAWRAPLAVRRNWLLGQLLGALAALLRGSSPRRLVVLERMPEQPAAAAAG